MPRPKTTSLIINDLHSLTVEVGIWLALGSPSVLRSHHENLKALYSGMLGRGDHLVRFSLSESEPSFPLTLDFLAPDLGANDARYRVLATTNMAGIIIPLRYQLTLRDRTRYFEGVITNITLTHQADFVPRLPESVSTMIFDWRVGEAAHPLSYTTNTWLSVESARTIARVRRGFPVSRKARMIGVLLVTFVICSPFFVVLLIRWKTRIPKSV